MTTPVAVLNGPNLDRLGRREPELYGTADWSALVTLCREEGARHGLDVTVSQHDGEGELVRAVHTAAGHCRGLVINPAAYTHTSVALRDALLAAAVPVVEVHITQPAAREPFRRRNLVQDVVTATVAGFGLDGYALALAGLARLLHAASPGA